MEEGEYEDFLFSLKALDVFKQLESASTKHRNSQRLNLLTEHAGDLLVWNEDKAAITCVSLKQLRVDPDRSRVWTLRCTHAPLSPVERLIISKTGKFVALICQSSIWVVEMPPGTKQMQTRIDCRSYPLGERYFATAAGADVGLILQARWHPSSEADIHLVVLTKDSYLRIFNVLDPEAAEQVIPLVSQPTALQSTNELTFLGHSKSYALDDSDNVVDFDFGPKCPVPKYHGFSLTTESSLVDQVFILKENGDVHCIYPRLHEDSRYPLFLSDALHMHPPAEDNYGVDACSLVCLSTTPTVLVVATAAGTIYHCVVMDQEGVDGENESEPGSVPLQTLYVYEAIDLELSGVDEAEQAGKSVGVRGQMEEDISCVVLHQDPVVSNRYHCSHHGGVHTVTLTWLDNHHQLLDESDDQFMLSFLHLSSKVEQMVATQPLPDSQSLPIVGLCISTDRLVGITLISVTALGECLAIRLMANLADILPPTRIATDEDDSLSPMHRLRTENFYSKVRRMLDRTKLPILRSFEQTDQISQQELFRVLVEHTQMFRGEISKLEHVRDEIAKRATMLTDRKKDQEKNLKQFERDECLLLEKGEEILGKCVEVQKGQVHLMNRLKHVLKELQTYGSVLSNAEKKFGKDLDWMNDRLHQLREQIETVNVKMTYRRQSMEEEPEVELSSFQNKQIRKILMDNGEMISTVMNELKRLQTESGL